jgi:hypothetical protein
MENGAVPARSAWVTIIMMVGTTLVDHCQALAAIRGETVLSLDRLNVSPTTGPGSDPVLNAWVI